MWSAIAVKLRLILEIPLAQIAGPMSRRPVGDHPCDAAILQTLADACGVVACVQSYGPDIEAEALTLTVKTAEIGDTVVDIAGSDETVGDDGVLTIHRPMIE